MEFFKRTVIGFFYLMFSYLVAISRLILWTILLFFSGLQRILFLRNEVVSVEFKVIPLLCDRKDTKEKLAYIDKLCMENPDLAEISEEVMDEVMNEDNFEDFDDEDDEE